jgi:hypothetical protein
MSIWRDRPSQLGNQPRLFRQLDIAHASRSRAVLNTTHVASSF